MAERTGMFLDQTVTMPLWAFIAALILPVGWLARQTRRVAKRRLGADRNA